MSASELTKEEVGIGRIRHDLKISYYKTEYNDHPASDRIHLRLDAAMKDVSILLTTLDAAWKERDDAAKEGLRLTVELEQRTEERDTCYDKDSGKTREINILTKETSDLCADRDRLAAQVQALEGSLLSTLVDLSAAEKDRDALRAEVENLHSQLAQRRISVPFPYQRDAPPREE